MDVQGPFRVPSLNDHEYIVGFIDAYSRMSFTYYVKHKSAVYDVFVNEFYSNNVIKYMQERRAPLTCSPAAIESTHVKGFLTQHGIRQMFTCTEHNGLIERLWRTLHTTMTSTMMNEKRVKTELWEEAHKTANYLYNRIPPTTVSSHGLMSPYQLFYGGSPPSLSNICIIERKAFIHKAASEMTKGFEPKAFEGILVGYDEDHTIFYRICIPRTNVLAITTHVTIDEQVLKLQNMYPFHPMDMTVSHTPTKFEPYEPPHETKAVSDFESLIESTHKDDDDGMVYQTTRVTNKNGLIVVYRKRCKSTHSSFRHDFPDCNYRLV